MRWMIISLVVLFVCPVLGAVMLGLIPRDEEELRRRREFWERWEEPGSTGW